MLQATPTPQDLTQIDSAKATWISQASLAFVICDGYFLNEEAGELELKFRDACQLSLHLFLRNFPSPDVSAFYTVFIEERFKYAQELVPQLYGSSPKRLNIVDCGAGIGLTSIYFRKIFPYSDVIGFEAGKTNVLQFQKNLKANGLSDVRILVKETATQLAPASSWLGQTGWDQVDILKLDAGVARALFNTNAWLNELAMVKILIVEASPELARECSLPDILLRAGFMCKTQGERVIYAWR